MICFCGNSFEIQVQKHLLMPHLEQLLRLQHDNDKLHRNGHRNDRRNEMKGRLRFDIKKINFLSVFTERVTKKYRRFFFQFH